MAPGYKAAAVMKIQYGYSGAGQFWLLLHFGGCLASAAYCGWLQIPGAGLQWRNICQPSVAEMRLKPSGVATMQWLAGGVNAEIFNV